MSTCLTRHALSNRPNNSAHYVLESGSQTDRQTEQFSTSVLLVLMTSLYIIDI